MKSFVGFFIRTEDWVIGEGFFLNFQSGYEIVTVCSNDVNDQLDSLVAKLKIGEIYLLQYKGDVNSDLDQIIHLKSQKIIWAKKKGVA